jgi:hypothetical protein
MDSRWPVGTASFVSPDVAEIAECPLGKDIRHTPFVGYAEPASCQTG